MDKLAIVGSGIAGLGCAHFLHRRFDLTVFEAGAHIGGHSNTIVVKEGDRDVPIDTGFMVYNEVTYPLLTELFRRLDVPTKEAPMSFSVQHLESGLEWNGGGLNELFAQRRNLLNLRHWRFLFQLNRFNKEAVTALDDPQYAEMTLTDYVAERGYGDDFLERYLIPMSSAVWSTPPEKLLGFPAVTLLRFWFNHGFLGLTGQHQWRTVDGGSRQYVQRLIKPFEDRIKLNTPVLSVTRDGAQATVETVDGKQQFDHIILASHADQSLRMLADATTLESELLAHFNYQPNDVDLHRDRSFLPKEDRAKAAWNYRLDRAGKPTIHYWMNELQGVSDSTGYFVSLNTRDEIEPQSVERNLQYDHPLFDLDAMRAQPRLPELNQQDNHTYFCGSYFRYGFHEDAFLSAFDLSKQILGSDPWQAN